MARRWLWLAGGVAVLALGGAGFFLLSRQPEAEAQEPPPPPLVETAEARAADRIVLSQTAFVRPVGALSVLPEQTARVAEVSAAFERGRRVSEGTVLVRLDDTDARAQVARADAALEEAEAAVTEARIEADRQDTLETRGVVAETVLQSALVGLASAEARLETARVEARLARDALEDADIVAPFDELVVEVSAEPGALVSPTTELGRLVSSRAVELEVGLLPRDLELVPGGAETLPGARVLLRPERGGPVLAEGAVVSVETGLAEGSRLLPLVVRVPDPFEGDRPLRLDELVLAEIPIAVAGGGALSLPARARKPGGLVWVVRDGALVRLEPELLIRQDDADATRVILRAGALRAGDRAMLTDLPAAAEGQEVRLEAGQGGAGEGGT
jgi:RND family efflux transporter MFP subunit